jgi:hypothetical protein
MFTSLPFIMPVSPIFFTTCSNCLWVLSRACTSCEKVPLPLAMRSNRSCAASAVSTRGY